MDDAYFDPSQMTDNNAQFGNEGQPISNDFSQEQMPNDQMMGQNEIPPMGDNQMMGNGNQNDIDNAESDDTMSIINQLNDSDKEAVRKYAESMLDKNDSSMNNNEEAPMMENVIFTKKQLNKIQENFGITQDDLLKKKSRNELPKKQTKFNDSPFSSPKFN